MDEKRPSGEDVDFYQDPILFEGSPADGTYPCVIIKSYDQLTARVEA